MSKSSSENPGELSYTRHEFDPLTQGKRHAEMRAQGVSQRCGVNFSQAVSNTPVCAAHRASLLTGKHSSSTGMVINELRMNPNHRCFGHVLTDNGYETGYIGKWHLWSNRAGHHQEAESSFIPPDKHHFRLGFDGYWAAYNFNHQYYKAFYFRDEPEHTPRRQGIAIYFTFFHKILDNRAYLFYFLL
jgi:arylsulfatase A-like enzyme